MSEAPITVTFAPPSGPRLVAPPPRLTPPSIGRPLSIVPPPPADEVDAELTEADLTVRAFSVRTNAELMEQCRDLGYLADGRRCIDLTYGLGRFWSLWRPDGLVTNDLDPACGADHHESFVDTAWPDHSFADVVFDPPYKLNGTGGGGAGDEAYGVADAYVSWRARHELIRQGILEAERICARRGRLLVKCQDQVSGGRVRWQTREFSDYAESLGCTLIDMLHVPGERAQPAGRRQVHARRNYSTLLVFLTGAE